MTSRADTDEPQALAAVPGFDTVYREQRGRVLGAVRAILGPSDEVDDVVQLAFIEIHRCLDRFEGRSRLSTWCYRIAINVALQHLRKKRRKRWLMLGVTGEESTDLPMPVHSTRRLEDREILEKVYRAVDTLSEKKRVVWILHELQGQDPNEIAELLSIPMNTVRSRLLAARRDLMDELARMGVTPDGGSQ
ncbi:MAG: RNA polymerase sigma factor [Myxococcota bacterium]